MGGLEDRLKKLEARFDDGTTPWYSLPPGEQPDWPRPLAHLSIKSLEVLNLRGIVRFCNAGEIGQEYRTSRAEVFEDGEVFHEIRWRKHGIARRSFSTALLEGWEAPTEEDVLWYVDTEEGRQVVELLEEANNERMDA
jgi:hypothetical protein